MSKFGTHLYHSYETLKEYGKVQTFITCLYSYIVLLYLHHQCFPLRKLNFRLFFKTVTDVVCYQEWLSLHVNCGYISKVATTRAHDLLRHLHFLSCIHSSLQFSLSAYRTSEVIRQFSTKCTTTNYSDNAWTKPRCVAFGSLAIVYTAATVVLSARTMFPTPETDLLFHQEVLEALEVDITSVGYVAAQLVLYNLTPLLIIFVQDKGRIDRNAVLSQIMVVMHFAVFLSICMVCWVKIGRHLQKQESTSALNYRHHRSCFILLSLQVFLFF